MTHQIPEHLILKLEVQYPDVNIRSLSTEFGPEVRNPEAVFTWRVKEESGKAKRVFLADLFNFMWGSAVVPEPAVVADWIESHAHRPPDWSILCQRLRAWEKTAPYPPIPDDQELSEGMRRSGERGWWKAGDTSLIAGGIGPMPSTTGSKPHGTKCTCEACWSKLDSRFIRG